MLQASLVYRVCSKTAKLSSTPTPHPFSVEIFTLVSTETDTYKIQTFYIPCGIQDVEAGGLLQVQSKPGLHGDFQASLDCRVRLRINNG